MTTQITREPQQIAPLRGLPADEVPAVRRTRCPRRQGPQGERRGQCPTVPSDLEATVGYPMDTKTPSKQEPVFGSLHQQTTEMHRAWGLAWPLGQTTSPANASEGTHGIAHRAALAMPVLPGQGPLGDAASDGSANDHWMGDHGGIAVFAYTPRNADRSPEALVERGDDPHGTPSAPWGRRCRSTGYDSQAHARPYVCGRPCLPEEQQACPHASGVRGSRHRMAFKDSPRLIGPIQRGPPTWQRLSAVRTARARTNSSDQDVIATAHPLRMRGLKALRFAGAIRTLAQRLRRALTFVLDVTTPLGQVPVVQTCMMWLFDH